MQPPRITVYCTDGDKDVPFDLTPAEDRWIRRVDAAFSAAERIGIIAPTCPEALSCWRAVLLSGRTPVMMQFPTPKLSRAYWHHEIANAVDTLRIDGIAHFGSSADPALALPTLDLSAADAGPGSAARRSFTSARAIQLSSGTTGFRKGVGLDMAQVMRHAADYNEVLQLGADDCVVSWLPLYHDMGFIANFIMPLLLGTRLVLVDPMTWVRRPQTLFELIDRHGGTLCFMPNFGFEVMARNAGGAGNDLSSMRQWISCSEPTRMDSLARFMEKTKTEPTRLANCYAMAENVFAVTHRSGLRCEKINQAAVVSCGKPIPGVSVKIVDGEVFVRSPYSLKSYESGAPIIDEDGFYPTGDIGEMIDGELFLCGRKRDIMIHAGRKYLLSDLDHAVGSLLPESAGRICVAGALNERLGTEEPVCLVEHERYWVKNRDLPLIDSIRQNIGLEVAKVEFVAPAFITKTSSGKINRRTTGGHWMEVDRRRQASRRSDIGIADIGEQLTELFPGLKFDLPFDAQLDSLGLVNLSMLLAEFGLSAEYGITPAEICARPTESAPQADLGPVINVVSLFDRNLFNGVIQPLLSGLGRHFGVAIHYQHVCTPPAPILLSDLIFEDYFLPRDPRASVYSGLQSALMAVRQADLIIADDLNHMMWPSKNQAWYPRLSHRFESAPRSAHMGVRWARYSENNHLVASEAVDGRELTPSAVNKGLDDVEEYLGTPILRVALASQFLRDTARWPVHCLMDVDEYLAGRWQVELSVLAQRMAARLAEMFPKLRRRTGRAIDTWDLWDQPHWCSWLVNPELVDFVFDRFDSFLVLGKPGSIPYLSGEAARRHKKLVFRSDLSCPPNGDYECVLQTGSWGQPQTAKPIFQLMAAGWGEGLAFNVPESVAKACPEPQ